MLKILRTKTVNDERREAVRFTGGIEILGLEGLFWVYNQVRHTPRTWFPYLWTESGLTPALLSTRLAWRPKNTSVWRPWLLCLFLPVTQGCNGVGFSVFSLIRWIDWQCLSIWKYEQLSILVYSLRHANNKTKFSHIRIGIRSSLKFKTGCKLLQRVSLIGIKTFLTAFGF